MPETMPLVVLSLKAFDPENAVCDITLVPAKLDAVAFEAMLIELFVPINSFFPLIAGIVLFKLAIRAIKVLCI